MILAFKLADVGEYLIGIANDCPGVTTWLEVPSTTENSLDEMEKLISRSNPELALFVIVRSKSLLSPSFTKPKSSLLGEYVNETVQHLLHKYTFHEKNPRH